MILRFLHGWGFDAGFWRGVTAQLPEWETHTDDRGYFGAPRTPDTAGPCIVVGHSFGAMRALAHPPAGCLGLVAINGFDRFTPGVHPRIVDRMIAKFASDPATVLAEFRSRCGDDRPFAPLYVAPLKADLEALRHEDRTAESRAWATPVLSLQGGCDPLLPAAMRDAAFAGAPLLERRTHPEAGHLLPLTDPAWCAQAIRAFAERVA